MSGMQENIRMLMNNQLKMDDCYSFKCNKCGKCCTNHAIEREPTIDIQENNISSNISALSTESESLPHISSENVTLMTMSSQSSPLALSSVGEIEYEEVQITPGKNIQFDTDVTIPATVYNSDGYVSLNKLEPGDYIDDGIVIDGEMLVHDSNVVSSRTVPSSMDMAYRLGDMNAKDSFALQNQTGRAYFPKGYSMRQCEEALWEMLDKM